VPKEAIRRLDKGVQNTAEEVKVIALELERIRATRVILVTSKLHTRRVRVIWRAVTAGRAEAIIRYTPDDPCDPDHWWRNTQDATALSHELFGLLNAWAGFPMRSDRE
jgi:hypothetical protein